MLLRVPAHIVFLLFILLPCILAGQGNEWIQKLAPQYSVKLSPEIKKISRSIKKDNTNQYLLEIRDTDAFYRYLRQHASDLIVVKEPLPDFVIVRCTLEMLTQVITQDFIIFADKAVLVPTVEGYVISHDLSVNAIDAVHQRYPDDNGEMEVISIKEDKMDSTDIDIVNRFVKTGVESTVGSTHATAMTTLVAGGGNSSFRGRGVALKSFYASSDFSGALPDVSTVYRSAGINTQNHSYGVGIQNYYGANAKAFDLSVIDNPTLTHVFSSGNSGFLNATDGVYSGVKHFANITGNMKMAKNALVVGAIDSNRVIPDASSRGPAYDGRLKPDLVAFAEDGSSGSAALVSGAAAVLQNVYKKKFGVSAGSDMIRAVLINSAEDVGRMGPDFIAGYGNMNLYNAVQTVKGNRIYKNRIIPFSEDTYLISLPANTANFKITLVWNDPVAETLAPTSVINNLDLTIAHTASGEIFQPWVLNISPHEDSLSLPAKPGRDTLNNTEQVSVELPLAGEYFVSIKSASLKGNNQAYALAWQYDSMGTFEWMYPAVNTKLEAGRKHTVRWKAVFTINTKGILEWSTDSITWNLINSDVDVNRQNTEWQIPNVITQGWIRMKVGGEIFYSEKFIINPLPVMMVGYVCDSTLLYWNNPMDHERWSVFQFDGIGMSKIKETNDTSLTILSDPLTYFALAPVIDDKDGLRGSAENTSQSGIGCYINNFLTDLIDDQKVRIRISLGTIYNVKEVVIEKIGNEVKEIFRTANITDNYDVTDFELTPGINAYRLKIILTDGIVVYAAINNVYYTASKIYVIFPVPAVRGTVIKLLQKEAKEISVDIIDVTGRWIRNYLFQDTVNEIPTGLLNSGVYVLRIKDEKGLVILSKLIIQ